MDKFSISVEYLTEEGIFFSFKSNSLGLCYRSDMTDDEYNESKEDTVEQLKEFNDRLNKITAGDMTIHDNLSIMRLVSIKFNCNL